MDAASSLRTGVEDGRIARVSIVSRLKMASIITMDPKQVDVRLHKEWFVRDALMIAKQVCVKTGRTDRPDRPGTRETKETKETKEEINGAPGRPHDSKASRSGG